MEIFHNLIQWVTQTTGLDHHSINSFFLDNHLAPLWGVLRDIYLNPYNIAFVFPLWLGITHFWPVDKVKHKESYLLDFLYPLLTLPIQVFVVAYGIGLLQNFYDAYVPFMHAGILDNQPLWIQTIGAFLVADFSYYVFHYISHKVPWLWYFHAIHHSQQHVNIFTNHRNHPFEKIIFAAVKIIPISLVGGTLPSIGIYLLFDKMWGYAIHANVRWNLGPLKYILVSPQNHRVHHTIQKNQFDHNFGARIILWDWLFGTLYKDFDDYPETGAKGTEWMCERNSSLVELVRAFFIQMIYPFIMIVEDIKNVPSILYNRKET